jgi:hypothetical protein
MVLKEEFCLARDGSNSWPETFSLTLKVGCAAGQGWLDEASDA